MSKNSSNARKIDNMLASIRESDWNGKDTEVQAVIARGAEILEKLKRAEFIEILEQYKLKFEYTCLCNGCKELTIITNFHDFGSCLDVYDMPDGIKQLHYWVNCQYAYDDYRKYLEYETETSKKLLKFIAKKCKLDMKKYKKEYDEWLAVEHLASV